MNEPSFPERFELQGLLGRGGGGEVWAARDRASGSRVALKVLHQSGGAAEAEGLIRETIALSGLEGLGFPRVLMVGRTPDGRLYLARELVDGESLEKVAEDDPRRALSLLCSVADVLTVVHRAGLLHGDVKPANVIVRPTGDVALVDLGLAAALREGGEPSAGLTPHFAAPEIHLGEPMTPQAEVYSLGVVVRDLLEEGADIGRSDAQRRALAELAERATAKNPAERFPSTDEFSQALNTALGGDAPTRGEPPTPWPVLGLDATAYALKRAIVELTEGERLDVVAPCGAGVSTLFRRVAWGMALEGGSAALVDGEIKDPEHARSEIARGSQRGGVIFVDGGGAELESILEEAQSAGARLVRSGESSASSPGMPHGDHRDGRATFAVPPLDEPVVERLLSGALPGLRPELFPLIIQRIGARPGPLKAFVQAVHGRPLVGERDVEEVLAGACDTGSSPQEQAASCLDRGRYAEAAEALAQLDQTPGAQWLRARYELAAGSSEEALRLLDEALRGEGLSEEEHERVRATRARALLGLGRYQEALDALAHAEDFRVLARAEALSYRGLAQTLLGKQEAAVDTLTAALEAARGAQSDRVTSLVLSSLATAQWRAGRAEDAERSYREAMAVAVRMGDSGILSSAQINLAGLLKDRGELSESIELLEAAVDTAQRAGRGNSVQQARLNLSNTDLYLGRLERARAEIARVGAPEGLPQSLRAQLHGLRAELFARTGELERALGEFQACERAWTELGRRRDASEAALEAILATAHASPETVRSPGSFVPSLERLEQLLARGEELLDGEETPLSRLARARVAKFAGRERQAEELAERALELAEAAGQREWAWRSCSLLAEILEAAGKRTRAARVREQAVEILEEIGARLPDDLRAVYWSDPRRSALRGGRARTALHERQSARPAMFVRKGRITSTAGSDAVSRMSQTPLERRLARILAINSDLAGEADLARLAEKIIAHAAELLGAERGFLLLGPELEVCAARGAQGEEHEGFSRSVAQEVVTSGKPVVSIDAERDPRLRAFESVHLDLVTAVACVPILSQQGEPAGALYLETRVGQRPDFADELPTLQAFADQAAIALGNARLLRQLEAKSAELEEKNRRLADARERLKGALGKRTQRLREVRQELRSTKSRLSSHAAYGGLVGGSEAMRRVYALIERIKDTDVPVLITGESGTGKEVVARAIHDGSARGRSKMLSVNCGAIPETILESELFGHTRGAFTGADRDRKGLFREADGGVLFLDEIGETPLKMQAGLLRVLQEKLVRPVGGSAEIPVDVRVVFATNRDLRKAVVEGRFREDLLYRIQVIEIALPALRERREDIPLLVDHFLDRFAARFGQPKKHLSRAAMARLLAHPFPGNVRQLENVLLNAWVMSEDGQIDEGDVELPRSGPSAPPGEARASSSRTGRGSEHKKQRKGTLSEHQRQERSMIVEALERTGWNRARAAEVVGMPRRTFYRRLKDYGIQ